MSKTPGSSDDAAQAIEILERLIVSVAWHKERYLDTVSDELSVLNRSEKNWDRIEKIHAGNLSTWKQRGQFPRKVDWKVHFVFIKVLLSAELGRKKLDRQQIVRYLHLVQISMEGHREIAQLFPRGDEFHKELASGSSPIEDPESFAWSRTQVDWDDAPDPDADFFCDRPLESQQLTDLLIKHRCRLVALLGIVGTGKTWFAARLIRDLVQTKPEAFEFVKWHSLQNLGGPPNIVKLLQEWLVFLRSDQAQLTDDITDLRRHLYDKVKNHRCLFVLDGFQALLDVEERVGKFRPGFEWYNIMFEVFGDTQHKSCLLLISNEQPAELRHRAGVSELQPTPVRVLRLNGFNVDQVRRLLIGQGLDLQQLNVSSASLQRLRDTYDGNPRLLKLVIPFIHENGGIDSLLSRRAVMIGDIGAPFDKQFKRLSDLERLIVYWLAIERRPVKQDNLGQYAIYPPSDPTNRKLSDNLRGRFMVTPGTHVTLPPVYMRYVTERLVEQISQEIESAQPDLLHSHALLIMHGSACVYRQQIESLLQPIVGNLLTHWRNKEIVNDGIANLLKLLRQQFGRSSSYAAGNVLNVLALLNEHVIRDFDFSGQCIWQANLRDIWLNNVKFIGSRLEYSTLPDFFDRVLSTAAHTDGSLLTGATDHGDIRLWETSPDGQETLRNLTGHVGAVRYIALSPDGRILASGGADHTLRLWNMENGKCLAVFDLGSRVQALAFSPDGLRLAVATMDTTIKLWSVHTSQGQIGVLVGNCGQVRALAFSTDGEFLVSGATDTTVRLWNVHSGEQLHIFDAHRDEIQAIAISADRRYLASVSLDRTVLVWDLNTRCVRWKLENLQDVVQTIAFQPVGHVLAGGNSAGLVLLWDVTDGQLIQTINAHTGRVWSLAFNQDGRLLTTSGDDQTVKQWDMHSYENVRLIRGRSSSIWSLACSRNGRFLACGFGHRKVTLWDIEHNSFSLPLDEHTGRVVSVTFSPDGLWMATACEDHWVRIWSVEAGQPPLLLHASNQSPAYDNQVRTLTFRPDGRMLASAGHDRTIRLWKFDGQKWTLDNVLVGHSARVRTLAFSPNGNHLLSAGSDHTIRLWDVERSICLHTYEEHTQPVYSVTFSLDNCTFASCGEDEQIKVWSTTAAESIHTLHGHTGCVQVVAFANHQQSLLASCGDDGSVRLWNVVTGEQIAVHWHHTLPVQSLAFSSDDKTLYSGGHDTIIIAWDLETHAHLALPLDRPFEGVDITDISGVSEAHKDILYKLGAVMNGGTP